jgi:hypothetical protein
MRTRYLEGNVQEVTYVQPEIRDQFWPNTRSCLRNDQLYEFKSEKKYNLKVESQEIEANISGKTDHVIQLLNCDIASITLEDKKNSKKMDKQDVSQAVTQVDFEVGQMEKHLNYAPVEYVGLLQNGPVWIAVLRKIDKGKVLWTYVQTRPAFVVNDNSSSQRTATAIDPSSCVEIARLIEHAYCTADIISNEILDPNRRPINQLYIITEYEHQIDDGENEDEDDQGKESGNSQELAPPDKVGAAISVPMKQRASQQQQSSKKSQSYGNILPQNPEYFILPLSLANVARHASTIY